jgi:collagenase-like PrtC family protease
VPLAISARCAHARSRGHAKDNCQFVCIEDPNGLAVDTLDGEAFLAINGVQTMSRTCQSLVGQLEDLGEAGVRRVRLSPQDCDMTSVARAFAAVAAGDWEPGRGQEQIALAFPGAMFSNGFHFGVEGVSWITDKEKCDDRP